MDEEFLTHKKCSEWWYCTGYLTDKTDRMFTFQFTLGRINVFGIKFHILLTSLTDFETGKHYFEQDQAFFGKNVVTTANRIALGNRAEMTFSQNQAASKGHMQLRMKGKNYSINIEMNAIKPPVWHCDNGVLQMGILDDPKQTTYYYSYTNLATTGNLIINGKEFSVTGKSWFDRQGGTYTITDRRVGWEWFSLRFFDNEEIMLFAFPQDDYFDGTQVSKTGDYKRLNKYTIEPLGFTQAGGYKFSNGWKLTMKGVKDEKYTLTPKIDGQFNFYFFELLAEIKDSNGTLVGYAVVELMPGVYNEKLDSFRAFKKV
ncbi:MAG: lipocalin-like domain-containing protein [Flexilinea sp.]